MGSVGGVDLCSWRSWIGSSCEIGVLCFWIKAASSEACYSVMTSSSEVECRCNSQVAQGFVRDRSIVQSACASTCKGRVAESREETGTSKAGRILNNKLRNKGATGPVYIVFLR